MVRLLADDGDEGIEVSDDGKILSIEVIRPTYKPLNVYRTFLKIALSIIPQEEYASYSSMLNVLNNDYDKLDSEIFCFLQHSLPKYNSYFNIPIVTHWNRYDEKANRPKKMFALYLDNKIIQIPIFSDDDFRRIYDEKETFKIPTVPPILNPIVLINDKQDFEFHKELGSLKFQHIDLSSTDKVKGEKDKITITKDENVKVETKNISIMKHELIDEKLDDQLWGFILDPVVNEYNKVDLKIIFDLKIPVNKYQHAFIKSTSFYQLENCLLEDLVKDTGYLADFLAVTMEHTYRMFLQKFPEHKNVKVRSFAKTHFHQFITDQLIEKKLISNDEE